MATLSVTTAWNETVTFVRREGRLLFPLAFMLIALPIAAMQALTPPPPAPDQPPPAGLWLLLLPVAGIASMIGNLAISWLALRPGTSVGEAIQRGARRFPMLLGAVLLLSLAGLALLFVAAVIGVSVVPGAAGAAMAGRPDGAFGTAILVTLAIVLPVILFFSARLLAMTPVAAAEDIGPLRIIGRAWALSAGHGGKLVGFVLLVGLAYVVLTGTVRILAGLVILFAAGSVEPGTLGGLLVVIVMAGVTTLVSPYVTSLIARIYAQLAGAVAPDTFA